MRKGTGFRAVISMLLPLALYAQGQGPIFKGTGSFDRSSPEATGVSANPRFNPPNPLASPADQLTFKEAGCERIDLYPRADLGVPAGGNIDAFSTIDNFVPVPGPAVSGWERSLPTDSSGHRRMVICTYTVDRGSSGMPGFVVDQQANGNGAASDSFTRYFEPDFWPPFLNSDAWCVTPEQPSMQTDLDALDWKYPDPDQPVAEYPVFYSIDAQTVMSLPVFADPTLVVQVRPGDVVMVAAAGAPPVILIPGSPIPGRPDIPSLLLDPLDDMDMIAVDGTGKIAFSLTKTSPSVLGELFGPFGLVPMGGAGIFVNGLVPWCLPWQLALLVSDELNGGSIKDPEEQHHGNHVPSLGFMCSDPLSGATAETSVWRMFDLTDRTEGFRVHDVKVGASLVQDCDFPIEVRLWGSSSTNPNDPRTLLGSSTVTYPMGTPPGTMFDHVFPDVLCGDPYLWVEMHIPESPAWPNYGAFRWMATDAEFAPTFFSDVVCGHTAVVPLHAINPGAIDSVVMRVDGMNQDYPAEPVLTALYPLSLVGPQPVQLPGPPNQSTAIHIGGLQPGEAPILGFSLSPPGPGGPCFGNTCIALPALDGVIPGLPASAGGVSSFPILLPPGPVTIPDVWVQTGTLRNGQVLLSNPTVVALPH